ncbi:MAG: sodium:solute symporter family protein [Candidatus Hydrogenedentales bacterium]
MEKTVYRTLEFPDYAMLVGYFVLMLLIGVYFYRHMREMKDYFCGGNAIPWWLSGVSFYMTSFSVAAFVFYPSVCYRHGWVGVTLLWVAVPAALFSALLFSKPWRRARIHSPVEYLETRYGAALRQVFAWQGVPVKIIDDAIKLFATGKFISICVGLDIKWSILGAGGIMLIYTFMGGLWAVAVTDFIQFVVLSVGILVVLPLSINKAGGLTAIFENSPDGFFNLTGGDFGWSYVLPLVVLYSLAWSSINWSLIQKYYCVPKEKDARKVGLLVVALYVIGPPLMFFPAIAAHSFIPDLKDAGDVYPAVCSMLLPAGMLGLAIAAMFAATMSTLSGDYNVCASVLTNDVYKRLIRPKASERELVQIGRLMTLLVGVVALGAAFLMSRGKAEDLFRIMVTLFGVATAPVAVPMLLGLVSRRATSLSAMVGFIAGLSLGLALFFLSYFYKTGIWDIGFMQWKPATEDVVFFGTTWKMEIFMFISTTIVTYVTMIVISLIKPMTKEEEKRSDDFQIRLATPIGQLPGDAVSGQTMMSPFRIVGICTIVIGVMMLALIPWLWGSPAYLWNVALGAVLIAIGLGLMFMSRGAKETA